MLCEGTYREWIILLITISKFYHQFYLVYLIINYVCILEAVNIYCDQKSHILNCIELFILYKQFEAAVKRFITQFYGIISDKWHCDLSP